MRRAVWLVISTSLLPFVHPAAQQLGQRIRVLATDVTPGRWVVGDLLAQDGDSLRLQVTRRAPPIAVARTSLKRLEVRRGQTRAWLAGARLGFGLGVIAGAVRHVSREHSRECDGWFTNECDDLYQGTRVVEAGLIGGALGGLLGAALGYAVRTERWEALPVGRARLAVAPSGTGLGLSFAF